MILGLSSFAFGWSVGVGDQVPVSRLSAMDLVDYAIREGVSCVQFGDNLPLHGMASTVLEQIRVASQAHSIRVEIGARKLTPENLSQSIGLCVYFASPLLRFVIDGDDYRPDLAQAAGVIRPFIPELRRRGIVLGIENHDRFKARELANLMESIGHESVGICLDCVNSMGAGEGLEQVLDVLAPYTVNLHLKDFTVTRLSHQMGFMITGTPAGSGMMAVPRIMEKIIPFKRCPSAVLEQWVPYEGDIERTVQTEKQWARQSLKYLKALPYFDA